MINKQECISINPLAFNEILRRIEKDGFIMKNKHGVFAKFTNTEERAKPENQGVFSSPFIGGIQAGKNYIRPDVFEYYIKQAN